MHMLLLVPAAAAGVRGLGKAAYRDVVQKLVANSGRV